MAEDGSSTVSRSIPITLNCKPIELNVDGPLDPFICNNDQSSGQTQGQGHPEKPHDETMAEETSQEGSNGMNYYALELEPLWGDRITFPICFWAFPKPKAFFRRQNTRNSYETEVTCSNTTNACAASMSFTITSGDQYGTYEWEITNGLGSLIKIYTLTSKQRPLPIKILSVHRITSSSACLNYVLGFSGVNVQKIQIRVTKYAKHRKYHSSQIVRNGWSSIGTTNKTERHSINQTIIEIRKGFVEEDSPDVSSTLLDGHPSTCFNDLQPETLYTIVMKSSNQYGDSDDSNVFQFETFPVVAKLSFSLLTTSATISADNTNSILPLSSSIPFKYGDILKEDYLKLPNVSSISSTMRNVTELAVESTSIQGTDTFKTSITVSASNGREIRQNGQYEYNTNGNTSPNFGRENKQTIEAPKNSVYETGIHEESGAFVIPTQEEDNDDDHEVMSIFFDNQEDKHDSDDSNTFTEEIDLIHTLFLFLDSLFEYDALKHSDIGTEQRIVQQTNTNFKDPPVPVLIYSRPLHVDRYLKQYKFSNFKMAIPTINITDLMNTTLNSTLIGKTKPTTSQPFDLLAITQDGSFSPTELTVKNITMASFVKSITFVVGIGALVVTVLAIFVTTLLVLRRRRFRRNQMSTKNKTPTYIHEMSIPIPSSSQSDSFRTQGHTNIHHTRVKHAFENNGHELTINNRCSLTGLHKSMDNGDNIHQRNVKHDSLLQPLQFRARLSTPDLSVSRFHKKKRPLSPSPPDSPMHFHSKKMPSMSMTSLQNTSGDERRISRGLSSTVESYFNSNCSSASLANTNAYIQGGLNRLTPTRTLERGKQSSSYTSIPNATSGSISKTHSYLDLYEMINRRSSSRSPSNIYDPLDPPAVKQRENTTPIIQVDGGDNLNTSTDLRSTVSITPSSHSNQCNCNCHYINENSYENHKEGSACNCSLNIRNKFSTNEKDINDDLTTVKGSISGVKRSNFDKPDSSSDSYYEECTCIATAENGNINKSPQCFKKIDKSYNQSHKQQGIMEKQPGISNFMDGFIASQRISEDLNQNSNSNNNCQDLKSNRSCYTEVSQNSIQISTNSNLVLKNTHYDVGNGPEQNSVGERAHSIKPPLKSSKYESGYCNDWSENEIHNCYENLSMSSLPLRSRSNTITESKRPIRQAHPSVSCSTSDPGNHSLYSNEIMAKINTNNGLHFHQSYKPKHLRISKNPQSLLLLDTCRSNKSREVSIHLKLPIKPSVHDESGDDDTDIEGMSDDDNGCDYIPNQLFDDFYESDYYAELDDNKL